MLVFIHSTTSRADRRQHLPLLLMNNLSSSPKMACFHPSVGALRLPAPAPKPSTWICCTLTAELGIYAHPSGQYFESWVKWGEHLASLLKEDLVHCTCQLCVGDWCQRAPANAAINVGLPLVAGGAVAVSLAATVAREEQRAREEEATLQSAQLLVRAAAVEDLSEWRKAIINEAWGGSLAELAFAVRQPHLDAPSSDTQYGYSSSSSFDVY
ncbi:hypothetical protein KCU95_g8328, partial [Aureobasidium melanogenum]